MIDTINLFEEDLPEVNQYTAEAKYVTNASTDKNQEMGFNLER